MNASKIFNTLFQSVENRSYGNENTSGFPSTGSSVETVSDATYAKFKDILYIYLIPIVALIGVVGNSHGLVIMRKFRSCNSAFVYLASLTVADILSLLVGAFVGLPHIISKFSSQLGQYWEVRLYGYLNIYLNLFSSRTVNILILILSFERSLILYRPMSISKSFIDRKAKVLVSATCIFTGVLFLPWAFMYNVGEKYNPVTNTTFYFVSMKKWAIEYEDLRYAYTNLCTVLTMYIPVFLILVVNCAIFIKLPNIKKFRKQFQGYEARRRKEQREQRTITLTHLSICVFYLLSSLSLAISSTIRVFNEDYSKYGREHNLFNMTTRIILFAGTCSSANDFIIFYVCSKQFRKYFCSAKQHKNSSIRSSGTSVTRQMSNSLTQIDEQLSANLSETQVSVSSCTVHI